MPKKPSPKSSSGTNKKPGNRSHKLKKVSPKKHRPTKKTAEEANRSNSAENAGSRQGGITSSSLPADFQAMEHAVEVEHERLKIFQTVLRYRQLVASGDESGLVLLVEMARLSCMALEFSEAIQTKMVHEAMKDVPVWPILWMADKNYNEFLIERAKLAGLGSKTIYDQKVSTAMKGMPALLKDPILTPKVIAAKLLDMMIALRAAGAIKLQNDESLQRQKQLVNDCDAVFSSMTAQEAAKKMGGDLKQCVGVFRRSVQAKEKLSRLLIEELNQSMLFFFGFFKKPVDTKLLEQYMTECMALPHPTPDSKSAWLAVARNIFLSMTDNAPHKVPEYQHMLNDFRRNAKDKRKRGRLTENDEKKYVIDAVKQAFENMLNLQSVPSEAEAGRAAS